MDLGPPGRAAATYGVAARSLAVAHSGWGSQACSLSVDLGAAAAARGFLFREWRPAPVAMELEDGPRAAGASGRGGDLRGRGSIAGCCAQRLGVSGALYPLTWVQRQRPAPISLCEWRPAPVAMEPRMDLEPPGRAAATYGVAARSLAVAHSGWGSQACSLSVDLGAAAAARGDSFSRMAASAGGDGARGWTSSRRGERPRRRPTSRRRRRRPLARSAPVGGLAPLFARRRSGGGAAVADSLAYRERRWRLEPRMDLGPLGPAADLRGRGSIAGCCAQRLGVSGVLSIR